MSSKGTKKINNILSSNTGTNLKDSNLINKTVPTKNINLEIHRPAHKNDVNYNADQKSDCNDTERAFTINSERHQNSDVAMNRIQSENRLKFA